MQPQRNIKGKLTLVDADAREGGISPQTANNGLEKLELRPGLILSVLNFKAEADVEVEFELDQSQLVFGCFLTGRAESTMQHRHQNNINTATDGGYCGVSILPELRGVNRFTGGVSVAAVHLVMEPVMMQEMEPDVYGAFPDDMRDIIEGKQDLPYFRTGLMTPHMQQTVNLILTAPFHSATQKMYLEGKSMELIALMLDRFVFPPQIPSKPGPLNQADIERIRAAHEHLLANMQSPPSLLTLARYVGLNDFKLKKGFRQVFGNSVFGCLHEHRMDQARRMLKDSDRSVKEISYAVGYKNAHSFSDAFKKYYGVRPSSYGT